MSRIDDLIAELCPDGVPIRPLGELGTFVRGRRFTKADRVDEGLPSIHYGEIYTHYGLAATATISHVRLDLAPTLRFAQPGDVIIAAVGETVEDVGKALAWLGTDQVAVHDDCFIFRSSLDPKYVVYFMQSDAFNGPKDAFVARAKVKRLSAGGLAQLRIPVPPLEVQREIVRVLDLFSGLEADLATQLDAELEARQRQHDHYRSHALAPVEATRGGSTEVALSKIVDFANGKPHERLVTPDGSIALLTARFISTAGKSARWVNPETALTPALRGDIAMVMSDLPKGRALARCFYVEEDDKYTANQRVCLLRVRNGSGVSSRWLYHFLDRNPQLLAYDNGQDQTHLKKGQILGVHVPVIPLAEQERAVSLVDRIDSSGRALISELQAEREARHKQYAYYRDRLLTFKELAA